MVLLGATAIIGCPCINTSLHFHGEHRATSFEGERETIKNGKGKLTLGDW